MVSITIIEKGGKPAVREFDQPEITIGRVQGNDIVLPKSNVSKRHARIVKNNNTYVVIDAKSTNGTYINGKRLGAPHDLRAGDKIFIGDFVLELRPETKPEAKSQPDLRAAPSRATQERQQVKTKELSAAALDVDEELAWSNRSSSRPKSSPQSEPQEWGSDLADDEESESSAKTRQRSDIGAIPEEQSQAIRLVHERLSRSVDLKASEVQRLDDEALRTRTVAAVEDIVRKMNAGGEIPGTLAPSILVDLVLEEVVGLGPLDELLNDPSVTEILVNHAQQIYVERNGKLQLTHQTFSSNEAVMGVIERIVAPLGRRIDENFPMVDARLRDGSRVNAIVPPLALKGPTLTIRKFTREPLQIDDLVAGSSLNADMAEFLEVCVQARKNIIISGGTGSGKTTLLNVISSFIDATERILTIEDAAELKLDQDHVVSLEARPGNIEGRSGVSIRELVRNALRMRPDRIIVGECRGGEALDMLQAMNTGHDGSLTTVHANSPRDALSRLETMVLMSGMDLPVRAIREQIANAVDILVQQVRFSDGGRRITHISEIVGMEGEVISMHDLFVFEQQAFSSDGRVQGRFKATGFVPKFYEGLRSLGFEPNLAIFRNS